MNHLPECASAQEEATTNAGGWDYGWPCICSALRACEQRYEAERRPIDVRATQLAVQHGFEQGVQAAREAVANAPWDAENWIAHAQRVADLAAIDALRGESA